MTSQKVIGLPDAVKTFIRPDITLHFSFTHNRPMAFAYEMIRQFRRQKLNLELVGTGFLEYAAVLIAAGYVRKLTGAFVGQTYPRPKPYKMVQQMLREGQLEIEWWTNLTMCQRFMAAAYGFPMIPTQSLKGSSLFDDLHRRGKAFIVNRHEKDVVLIDSCIPDVAIVHAAMADEEGNAVVPPPYGENLWGVWAARQVIVTTEKLVPSEQIRRLSHLVRIPGHLVDAVVEVPFGAHPYGVSPIGLQHGGYKEDYAFRTDLNKALDRGTDIFEWMSKWRLDQSHEAFLQAHANRLQQLHVPAMGNSPVLPTLKDKVRINPQEAISKREMTAVMASRVIVQKVIENDIKTLLAGIGISHLAAWMSQKILERKGYDVKLLTETGYYGYKPAFGDPYIFNFDNLYTNFMQSDFVEILGQIVPDLNHRCLAVLSAAQIDRNGNLNSTFIADAKMYLVGSGGANDISCTAYDIVSIIDGGLEKFVHTLPYVTAPGQRIRTVVTPVGVFERDNEQQNFAITRLMPGFDDQTALELEKLCSITGWKHGNWKNMDVFDPPTNDEILLLRSFDPENIFLK